MSLDIYVTRRYPQCECCGREAEEDEVWSGRVTGNLVPMAKQIPVLSGISLAVG